MFEILGEKWNISKNYIVLLVISFTASVLLLGFIIGNLFERAQIFHEGSAQNIDEITNKQLGVIFENYLENKKDDSEKWMTFVGILSTLFAVFFVYTGFKIDSTKEKVNEAEKRILDTEKKVDEEIYQYAIQLEYSMSFIIQKQFSKAIDALTILRNEPHVLKDDRKINTCCFFLAHCYYEKGQEDTNIDKKKESFAFAVEYINQAIVDPTQPFKNEIINAFTAIDKSPL